jgi:hypothetical protein
MFVQRIAGQSALRLYGLCALGEDGDAIERFLSMPDCAIARALKVGDGKTLILRLHLLQTGNVGLRFLQPFEQSGQTRLDAINIVSRNTHAGALAGKSGLRTCFSDCGRF